MQHNYEQLGDARFQQFCQALLVAQYPGLQCMPVGMPDGGRDALLEKGFDSSDAKGALVFQVKFVKRPNFLKDPAAWASEVVEAERQKITNLIARGAERYILLTNLPGSSHLDDGSIDQVQAELDRILPIASQCLWRDDLDRRVEGNWDIKWSYPDLMTGTDLIRGLIEGRLSESGEQRSRVVRAFLADQYRKDREVRFRQIDLTNDLLDVFIDVPARLQPKPDDASRLLGQRLRHLARDETMEFDGFNNQPSYGAGSLLLDPWIQEHAQRLVVEGAPGQGKSTMLQLVCQVHRMRLLEKQEDLDRLPPEQRSSKLLVPIRVELREFAQWLSGVDPFGASEKGPALAERTLEGFIAALIRSASGGAKFDVSDLHAILAISPVFLGLDGLDEVVDVGDRSQIVNEISRSINRLEAIAASLQVVVTSRPASFTAAARFPSPFQYLMLVSLTRKLINIYRDRWIDGRQLDESNRHEVSRTLEEKLNQAHFRDLCRNPMQLAIVLNLIQLKGPALPERRTDLYRSYMEHFLDREATKSRSVRDHRQLLLLLHGHVACILHIQAEQSPRKAGRISARDLIRTAESFVASQGHAPDLFGELIGGVFDRFGALVSRVQGTFEFEVQPLREYFAGYYLYETAPYSPTGRERKGTRPERLDVMMRHRFWLNVVRFYAGCYSMGELESLAGRLESLADDDKWRWTPLPRTVAAQLLADWTLDQDRRALTRSIEVVHRDLAVRHAGSGEDEDLYFARNRPFILPAESGGAEFVEALFKVAERPDIRGDRLHAIAHALSANASTEELSRRWLKNAVSDSNSLEDKKWWRLGDRLKIFRVMPRDHLISLVGENNTEERLLTVTRSGVLWPADESQTYAAAVIDDLLSNGFVSDGGEPNHPLTALSRVLRLDHIAMSREMDFIYYEIDWRPPTSRWPSYYRDVITLANNYDAQITSQVQWIKDLEPWRYMVDLGRELFGEREAFDRLALVSSAVTDARRRGGGHSDLHDHAKSLVLRARYARYNSGAVAWWRNQLVSAPDYRSEDFTLALLLSWATQETIESLHSELLERVEALSTRRYAALFANIHHIATFRRGYRMQLRVAKVDTPSSRLYVLLAVRRSDRDGKDLYNKHRYQDSHGDPAVISYLLGWEVERVGARQDLKSWERALKLMRRLVEHEADAIYGRLWRLTMPRAVAMRIVEDAEKFPLRAIQIAEDTIAEASARETPSVGEIADRDGWLIGR